LSGESQAALIKKLNARARDLKKKLSEALEQQTATSDVLKVISRSAFELQPVFDTVVENAVRLCEAERAFLFQFDGELLRYAASYNASPELREFVKRNPIAPGRHSISARAALDRRTVHVRDVQADPEYAYAVRDERPIRTMLAVPMVKGDDLVGTITIYRQEVKPFTDKQIALVETFADQAVIAIENVRLFDEVQGRTRELSEALDQQTATSEVLQVISRSPGELDPVFEAMLSNATRLCEATYGILWLREGEAFRIGALEGPLMAEHWRKGTLHRPSPDVPLVRVAQTRRPVHIADMRAEPAYLEGADPLPRIAVESAGMRTLLSVPMLKDNDVLGAIAVYRTEVRPFSDKQVDLVSNFARQAIIAIETTRLLNELRESLQQQTATADVLKVISRSTFDLQMVLATLTESAAKLCEADMAAITRDDGQGFRHFTDYGFPPDWVEFNKTIRMLPGRGSVVGRALMEAKTVQVPDVLADPEYTYQESAKKAGFRTFVAVPLMREGNPIGVLTMGRKSIAPFTDKQIELVSTFADQAVIAIENVRLFDEVQARTRELARSVAELRALGEVSRAVGSTLKLETVLETIVACAVQLSGSDSGIVYEFDEVAQTFQARGSHRISAEHLAIVRAEPIRFGEGAIGRAGAIREPVQVADRADGASS
jgi:two-component system, NtrC family, sensor kinase